MSDKIKNIYNYFVQSNLLNELKFEKDIHFYCKNNINIIEKNLDDIMMGHVQTLKDMGLYSMSPDNINGLNENIDKILKDEKVRLFDVWDFIIDKLESIIYKYTKNDNGLTYIDEDDVDLNNLEIVNFHDEVYKQSKIKHEIMQPTYKSRDIEIMLSAATLNETYMWYVTLYNKYEKAVYTVKSGFLFSRDDADKLDDTYIYLFNAIKERKKYHNGILDNKIDYFKKIEALEKTLSRLCNILDEAKEIEKNKKARCTIAYENIRNYTTDDILLFLKETNFNYLDHSYESYAMFESLIELVAVLKNTQNKKDAKRELKKLKKYEIEYKKICDWFEVDSSRFHIPENIDQYTNIPLNKVFSYVIKFYKRYYDKDEEDTRELLKIFFSNAMTLSDTNFAQNEYSDILKYNNDDVPLYQIQFLYPTYIFKHF